jgi:periplasmic protein CpxP/Spy
MKSLRRHLLTAGLLAGLGIAAVAQTQTPPTPPAAPAAVHAQGERRGPHGDPAQFRARMEERMARRMGELKTKLQITPAQEGAWTAWTTAMKPAQLQRPERGEFARLSTPERIDRIRALRTQRNAEMDKRFDATKTFYTALNVEQKKVFDGEAMRFMRGGKHGGHGHGRHHRG